MRVNSPEFWKQRLEEYKNDLRLSVYHTSQEDWDRVNEAHKRVVQEVVYGKVLDAGCAFGRVSEWVQDYTGVDISPDFIDIAQRMYPDRKFLVGDLKKLPFKDKEFDWAICVSIKAMINREVGKREWIKIRDELKRVSKNILILEYSFYDKYEIL